MNISKIKKDFIITIPNFSEGEIAIKILYENPADEFIAVIPSLPDLCDTFAKDPELEAWCQTNFNKFDGIEHTWAQQWTIKDTQTLNALLLYLQHTYSATFHYL